jgi:hypothetical protein
MERGKGLLFGGDPYLDKAMKLFDRLLKDKRFRGAAEKVVREVEA